MYTSVICILLKEHMCALLVLTEIWNSYIPKHMIYLDITVFTPEQFIYLHGIFGSAGPHPSEPSKRLVLTQFLVVLAPPTTTSTIVIL